MFHGKTDYFKGHVQQLWPIGPGRDPGPHGTLLFAMERVGSKPAMECRFWGDFMVVE